MTLEIRFTYIRGRGIEESIMLELWNDGKPTGKGVPVQHVTSDHECELFHNYSLDDKRFIGVGLKWTIDE